MTGQYAYRHSKILSSMDTGRHYTITDIGRLKNTSMDIGHLKIVPLFILVFLRPVSILDVQYGYWDQGSRVSNLAPRYYGHYSYFAHYYGSISSVLLQYTKVVTPRSSYYLKFQKVVNPDVVSVVNITK